MLNVGGSSYMNPPRVSLRLVNPGVPGPEVVFYPRGPLRLNSFAKNPVIEDPCVRVYNARNRR